jgi:osmotically-inducible protein OsmY
MMIRNIRVFLAILLAAGISACSPGEKKEPESKVTALPPAADNTAINERDRADVAPTPTDQGSSEADLAILAKIRQAVVDDKALSTNAHNVKIITNNGVVTLRGPVKSAQEKSSIEAMAKQVTGVTKVENHLEIESAQ